MADELEKTSVEETEESVTKEEKGKDAKKAKKKKAKSHKVVNYLKELKSELKKITWYSRKDTLQATLWVCVALVIFGAILGLVDYLLGHGVAFLGTLIS